MRCDCAPVDMIAYMEARRKRLCRSHDGHVDDAERQLHAEMIAMDQKMMHGT